MNFFIFTHNTISPQLKSLQYTMGVELICCTVLSCQVGCGFFLGGKIFFSSYKNSVRTFFPTTSLATTLNNQNGIRFCLFSFVALSCATSFCIENCIILKFQKSNKKNVCHTIQNYEFNIRYFWIGKARGLLAARVISTHRREDRWMGKKYIKSHLGSALKANPFGGAPQAKGIVLEKMFVVIFFCCYVRIFA